MKTTKPTEQNQLDEMYSKASLHAASTLWPERVKAEKTLQKHRGGADKRLEARKALSSEMTELSAEISKALEAGNQQLFQDLMARHQALKEELNGADDSAASAKIEKAKQAIRDIDQKELELKNVTVGAAIDDMIATAEQKARSFADELSGLIKLRNAARARGAVLKIGSSTQTTAEALYANDPLRWISLRDNVRPQSAPLPKGDAVSDLARHFAHETSADLYARAQAASMAEDIANGDLVPLDD